MRSVFLLKFVQCLDEPNQNKRCVPEDWINVLHLILLQ